MTAVDQKSPRDRAAYWKSLRATTPLVSQAELPDDPKRPNPITLLAEQAATRIPELVPVR